MVNFYRWDSIETFHGKTFKGILWLKFQGHMQQKSQNFPLEINLYIAIVIIFLFHFELFYLQVHAVVEISTDSNDVSSFKTSLGKTCMPDILN